MFFVVACSSNQTVDEKEKSHPSHQYTFVNADNLKLNYHETDYLPVYSDIYHRDGSLRFMLAVTVSIRNTSLTDSAYILKVTYFDSYGKEIAEYAEAPILLQPLESIEFVIDEGEQVGGAGANFIIDWGAGSFSDQLLIQPVMIGTYRQQGISFVTTAKPIEQKNGFFVD